MKATRTVFRTVVIAGAMIGTPIALAQAPSKDAPVDKKGGAPSQETPPTNKNTPKPSPNTPTKNKPVDKPSGSGSGSGDGSGSGSGQRPRTSGDRPTGRGFVLA